MKTPLRLRKRVSQCVLTILLAGLAGLHGVALAATAPELERLSPLTDKISSPTDVALDSSGHIYVAEETRNRVTILNHDGLSSGKMLSNILGPSSVAVDGEGRIYVGSIRNGSVKVFGPDLSELFALGSGEGEFGKPSDIAIAASGNVYVADSFNNAVKVYDASGNQTGTIGTTGNDNGQLNRPLGVAIDANAGEIIVLDRPMFYDFYYGTEASGARIQYFDMDGNVLRSYNKYGYNNTGTKEIDPETGKEKTVVDVSMGQFTSPNGIAVDSMSRVYVTDAYMQNVMVYDNQDNFLGATDHTICPLRIPQGIAIGASNRLYVVSRLERQIEVLGIDNYTSLQTTPSVLEFQFTETSNAPASQAAIINNTGTASINWTASTQDSWVSLGATSGTVAAAGSSSLNVSVNPEGLAFGTHTGNVVIDTGAGAADKITVILNVVPNPLEVTPASVSMATTVGKAPGAEQLIITSGSDEAQNWTATADQPWITMTKGSGTTADAIEVSADVASLGVGTYNGIITVAQDNTNPAKVEIAVSLQIDAIPMQVAPGSLNFSTSVGTTAAGQGLAITSGAEGEVSFEASADQPWITLTKTSGTVPGTIRVYADTTSLTPGSYSGTVTVTQVGDPSVSIEVPVSLSLSPPTISSGNVPFLSKDQWDKKWIVSEFTAGTALNAVAGSSKINVFVAGENGAILHFNGEGWSEMNSGTSTTLNSVWSGSGSSYAVGEDGLVLSSNGSTWIPEASGETSSLQDIWGSSDIFITAGAFGTVLNSGFTSAADLEVALRTVGGSSASDIYVAGEAGAIFRGNGNSWSAIASGTDQWLNSIWSGSATNAVAVGENGAIVMFDGKKWSAMNSGTSQNLNGVCGFSATDIYAVGNNSLMLHFDGTAWSGVDVGAGANLNDILCTGKGDIFAVGDEGVIVHARAIKKGKGKNSPKGQK